MAATDATSVPIRAQAFRLTFALRLNTGAVNSGAAGLQAQVSKDGATFVNTTNSPTEIATASGIYYLDLTGGAGNEMDARTVAVIVKSSTSGAVTADFVLNPVQKDAGDIPIDVNTIRTSVPAAQAQNDLALMAVQCQVDTATFSATTTDFETTLITSVATDFYKGRSIIFKTGTLTNQAARVTGSTYTANNKVRLTVTALTAAPANNDFLRMV